MEDKILEIARESFVKIQAVADGRKIKLIVVFDDVNVDNKVKQLESAADLRDHVELLCHWEPGIGVVCP